MPKIYTTEFKDTVVEFYERGHSVSETLTEYRISESSLFDWKKDYDIHYFLEPAPKTYPKAPVIIGPIICQNSKFVFCL